MNDEHTSRSASTTEPLWKLAELASHVAVALSAADVDQASGRVRDVPNARTIRYYTTLGLVDRPVEFRGRTAYYSRRHLLQLVAIKRLQARGMTLETIQERLLGLTSAQLAQLAQLPEVGSSPQEVATESSRADAQPPSRRHTAFWAAAPTPIPEPGEDDAGLSKVRSRPTRVTRPERRGLVQGVRL
ncbi:MAG: helix-turn-helix domain-containing protein, partial [Myxococcota bacterium]